MNPASRLKGRIRSPPADAMSGALDPQSAARAVNARLAYDYDAMPYLPEPEPLLDLERIFGLAAVYGLARDPTREVNVLDLGCGIGSQLARAAQQAHGSLVGTDISPSACAGARARLAPHGDRVRIIEGDLLDLDPRSLGTFDVIYAVGLIYVVPAPVLARVLEILGTCLKPGGLAVLSYYAGALGALKPQLNQILRAATDPGAAPTTRTAQAREVLRQLNGQFAPNDTGLSAQLIRMMASYRDDTVLYHETFCDTLTALSTGQLASALHAHGLRYLSYLHPMPYCGMAQAQQRSNGADVIDFMHGGYRYAAFAKDSDPESNPLAARAPRWMTGIRRNGPDSFRDPALGVIRATDEQVQAALDRLVQGPARREDLPPGPRLDAELQKLWQGGWLTPLAP
jgi:SAM-dependent methyltransferase